MNSKINTILIGMSAGLVILLIGILTYLKIFSSDENYWICNNGVWIKHGNPKTQAPKTICQKTTNNSGNINTGTILTATGTGITQTGNTTIEDKETEQLLEEIDKMFKDLNVKTK